MTGYIGTFYDLMAKDTYFMMLSAFGFATGIAFFLLKKPLEKVIGSNI